MRSLALACGLAAVSLGLCTIAIDGDEDEAVGGAGGEPEASNELESAGEGDSNKGADGDDSGEGSDPDGDEEGSDGGE